MQSQLLHFWSSVTATFLKSCPENLAGTQVKKGRLTGEWAKEARSCLSSEQQGEHEGRSIKKGWMGVPQCCQRGVCSQMDKGSVHFVSCGKLRHRKFSSHGKDGRRSRERMESQGLFSLPAWRARGWEEMKSNDPCCWEGTHKMLPSPARPALPQQLGFL